MGTTMTEQQMWACAMLLNDRGIDRRMLIDIVNEIKETQHKLNTRKD